MNNLTKPIGIFDSGVGGLSILAEIKRLIPEESLIYFSDSGHVPYGEKTPAQLFRLSGKICRFLKSKGAKLIVIACNTATTYCIEKLRKKFKLPFVGTVPPVKPAAKFSKTGKIAVMATPATIKSHYLENLISNFAPNCKVIKIPAYGLENQVEAGKIKSRQIRPLLVKFLKPAILKGIDCLALGCTHYPFLLTEIKKITGDKVKIFDPAPKVAKRVKQVLFDFDKISKAKNDGQSLFYTTGVPQKFSKVASQLLKMKITAQGVWL